MPAPVVAAAAPALTMVFKRAVKMASDKLTPMVKTRAKTYVAKALNRPAPSINLGQEAMRNDGNAQLVAEAMVRSGSSVDSLFASIPFEYQADLNEIRIQLEALNQAENLDSDKHAKSISSTPLLSISAAVQLRHDNDDIRVAIRRLGLPTPEALWDLKVLFDHLTHDKIMNYKVFA